MIWFKDYLLEDVKKIAQRGGMVAVLGIDILEIGADYLKARMPVNEHTRQTFGILHGGATCALVETVGSFASGMCLDPELQYSVGSFINVNHIRPVSNGHVIAVCTPVHIGRQKHVWDVRVTAQEDTKLIAKGELTCAVLQGKLDLARTSQ